MAAELVETSRLWARVDAKIEPEWVEPLAQHLVKRTYSEPHWEKNQGAVMAYEKVTLYGVPIVVAPQGQLRARSTPSCRRELFIRHALVEGDWDTHHRFFHDNRKLLARSRSWRTGPGAATSSSTTRRCSTSTTSGCPRRWSPAALRHLVEEEAPRPSPTC